MHRSDEQYQGSRRQQREDRPQPGAHRMSARSRLMPRTAWFAGGLATTLVILGGFAVVSGRVGLGTVGDSVTQVLGRDGREAGTGDPATSAAGATGAVDEVTSSVTVSASPSATATSSPATTTARRTPTASASTSAKRPATSSAPRASAPPAVNTGLAEQVLAQINAARSQAGLPALVMSAGLVRSAAAHNQVMAAGCGLKHQCSGEADLGKRISAQGVSWTSAGENIGEGGPQPNTDAGIVSMAKQLTADMLAERPPNDGHRRNILSTSFKHIGIALYRDSKGTVWMTQDFAS